MASGTITQQIQRSKSDENHSHKLVIRYNGQRSGQRDLSEKNSGNSEERLVETFERNGHIETHDVAPNPSKPQTNSRETDNKHTVFILLFEYCKPLIRPHTHLPYSETASRLATYTCNRSYFRYDFRAYADNGFYYTGRKDCLRCFSCNIGLKDWDDDDADPYMQHINFSPGCPFLSADTTPDNLYVFTSVKYSEVNARKESLSKWCQYVCKETIETIAKHGYYYTGYEHQICCTFGDTNATLLPVHDLDLLNQHKTWCPVRQQIMAFN